MLTGLPQGFYRQEDVARHAWPNFARRDLQTLYYSVSVLPLQRRVRALQLCAAARCLDGKMLMTPPPWIAGLCAFQRLDLLLQLRRALLTRTAASGRLQDIDALCPAAHVCRTQRGTNTRVPTGA